MGEWATVVGGGLLAVAFGGVLAVRVIGPGLRDTGGRADGSFWHARRTAFGLVLGTVVLELLVAGRVDVEVFADRVG